MITEEEAEEIMDNVNQLQKLVRETDTGKDTKFLLRINAIGSIMATKMSNEKIEQIRAKTFG